MRVYRADVLQLEVKIHGNKAVVLAQARHGSLHVDVGARHRRLDTIFVREDVERPNAGRYDRHDFDHVAHDRDGVVFAQVLSPPKEHRESVGEKRAAALGRRPGFVAGTPAYIALLATAPQATYLPIFAALSCTLIAYVPPSSLSIVKPFTVVVDLPSTTLLSG